MDSAAANHKVSCRLSQDNIELDAVPSVAAYCGSSIPKSRARCGRFVKGGVGKRTTSLLEWRAKQKQNKENAEPTGIQQLKSPLCESEKVESSSEFVKVLSS